MAQQLDDDNPMLLDDSVRCPVRVGTISDNSTTSFDNKTGQMQLLLFKSTFIPVATSANESTLKRARLRLSTRQTTHNRTQRACRSGWSHLCFDTKQLYNKVHERTASLSLDCRAKGACPP
ncbi:hypothetical protein EVAR_22539_1 [Eumeta japonica]|uniref:Uncharacterized protein n=1 Tax=Eumeta variegata TaxID=151549 RepID=A0A4C1U777_EUMVA|nr:hypothetical protein EVAR_22539_1 [Eumeta japonica]